MFNLFKSKTDNAVYAPVKGRCVDITEVDDVGFSSKSMGDGIAIIPSDNVVTSPCNGVLKMVFRTGHAFAIEADNGLEILIHIGIDTVNLEGKGFKVLKKVDSKVKKGEPIVSFDLDEISKEYDPSTLVIITNGKSINKTAINNEVNVGDVIFEGDE